MDRRLRRVLVAGEEYVLPIGLDANSSGDEGPLLLRPGEESEAIDAERGFFSVEEMGLEGKIWWFLFVWEGGVDLAGDGSCFRARFIVGLMGFVKGKTGRPNYERWSVFVRLCFCLFGLYLK